jgi:LPPG:FO 2-phospho-L-lactate transferase
VKVVALSGGVGGARLVVGLAQVLPAEDLTVVVNTGDDFEHWGLWVSPDLDTVMYTLAGLSPVERGWGLDGETFGTLERVQALGGEDWFQIGDRDLATHLVRTSAMRKGATLTSVTAQLCSKLGVKTTLLPMCDEPCPTTIDTTSEGILPFQQWLVGRRAEPSIRDVCYAGVPAAAPGAFAANQPAASADVLQAVEAADVVVITPSNPYVSINTILSRDGMREAVSKKPVIAVSPLVGGKPVKGPLDRMIRDLERREADVWAIIAHYSDMLSGFVVQPGDAPRTESRPSLSRASGPRNLPVFETDTIMSSRAASAELARNVLAFAEGLQR